MYNPCFGGSKMRDTHLQKILVRNKVRIKNGNEFSLNGIHCIRKRTCFESMTLFAAHVLDVKTFSLPFGDTLASNRNGIVV